MSHPHTRKSFLAKLVAILAACGLVPAAMAKKASSTSGESARAELPFSIQPDPRSVARTDRTV